MGCVPSLRGIEVRRVYQIPLLLSLAIAPLAQAAARERVAMPFDCGVERGRVWVAPAAERSYPIIGERDEQIITTCRPPQSGACRTIMVHRFAISCGGSTVSWMRVAGAIRHAAATRAWIEDGRLNLVLAARGAPDARAECFEPHSRGASLERRVVLARDCLPWRRRAELEHVVLPAGFAPVGELGARLLIGPAADETDIAGNEAQAAVSHLEGGQITLVKADPNAVLAPSAAARSFDAALAPTLAADDWITVVRAEDHHTPSTTVRTAAVAPWAWLLGALSIASAALLAHARYAPLGALRSLVLGRQINPDLAAIDRNIANAAAAVGALLQQTETATAQLKSAGALREVLQSELGLVRQRLSSLETLVAKGEVAVEKSAPQFRGLVRELGRIRRIVDSAAASLSGARISTALPRTTSEAYEVLGVNAEVSAGILKKIVDALRMSWHPDHARDDADRLLREDRIRQINIAWELINGKREAA